MLYLILGLVLGLQSTSCDGREKIITVKELPKPAQTLLSTHFKGKQVSLVQKDVEVSRVNYDVMLNDGTKLEFDTKGDWTEIDCKPSEVPAILVPPAISKYVKANYSNMRIVQIERDRWGYEVDLSNGLDIKFNTQFKVIEIDD